MANDGKAHTLEKAILWLCACLAGFGLLGSVAMFAKATWQYLSLPLYGCGV